MLSALTFPRFHYLKDQEYLLFNSNHLVLLSLVCAYPKELLDTDQSMYLISLYSPMLGIMGYLIVTQDANYNSNIYMVLFPKDSMHSISCILHCILCNQL